MKNSNNPFAATEAAAEVIISDPSYPVSCYGKPLNEMSYEELKKELQDMAAVLDDQPYYHEWYIVKIALLMAKMTDAKFEEEAAQEVEEAWAE